MLQGAGDFSGFRYTWVSGNAVDSDVVMRIQPVPAGAALPDGGDTHAGGVTTGGTTAPGAVQRAALGLAEGATAPVTPQGGPQGQDKARGGTYTTWGPESLAMSGSVGGASGEAIGGVVDPWVAEQWHLEKLGGLDRIWNEFTGKGIKVGVYDAGVQYAHEDLAPNYDASLHVTVDGRTYDGDSVPLSGAHGTSVAGLIAAARNGYGSVGVAYDASLTA